MLGNLASLVFAVTPVLVDAPPARACELLAALTSDGTFGDFDDTLRAPGSLNELESMLASIPALLRALNLEEVERRLSTIEGLLPPLRPAEAARLQRAVWFYRGFTKHLQDESRPGVGEDDVVSAVAIDRELELELPKAERFTRWVDEQRRRAARLERISHRVTGNQAALVWVDGVPRGVAPVELELSVGAHVVSSTSPGRERRHQLVNVRPGTPTRLEEGPPLSQAALEGRAAILDAARSGARPAQGRPAEVVVVREGLVLQVVRVSGEVGPPQALAVATPSALRSLLSASITSPASASTVERPGTHRRALVAPVVSFVGSALLAIGGLVTFGFAQDRFASAAQVPQVEVTSYGQLMNEGRGLMAASGVLGVLALTAASVGVVFLLD